MPPKFELKPQGILTAGLKADITMRKAEVLAPEVKQIAPEIPKGTFWWRTPSSKSFTELREVHHDHTKSWIADGSPMPIPTGMYFLKLLEQAGDYSNEEIPTWPDWAIEIRVTSSIGGISYSVFPNLLCVYMPDPLGFGGNMSLTAEAWLVVPGQEDVRLDDGQAVFGIAQLDVTSWVTFTPGATEITGEHGVSLPQAYPTNMTYPFSFADATTELGGSGSDYYWGTLTSASFTDGVTLSGGTITVPAGVQSFTVTVVCYDLYSFTTVYCKLTVDGVFGVGQIGGI